MDGGRFRLPRGSPTGTAILLRDSAVGDVVHNPDTTKLRLQMSPGPMRYAFRYVSSLEASPPRQLSSDDSSTASHDRDCCFSMSWQSRIPLAAAAPSKQKHTTSAIIKQGIFSPGDTPRGDTASPPTALPPRSSPSSPVQQSVYRGAQPWANQPRCRGAAAIIRRCFTADKEECPTDSTAAVPHRPPPPPLRRRALVRSKPDLTAYFRSCTSAESEKCDTRPLIATSCAPSKESLLPDSNANMERLNKFRFGGRGKSSEEEEGRPAGMQPPKNPPHKKKAPRSTDKAERLRQLTERLKVSSIPSASGSQPSALSKHDEAGSSKEDDLFECEEVRLNKPESRAIVGSYIQRTIPFRSASFSQVDFSPDGKYVRSSVPCRSPEKPVAVRTDLTSGSVTLPRKRVTSAQVAVSPAQAQTKPSQTSPAVLEENVAKTTKATAHYKPIGSRSMTHPLPAQSRIADIPYSSIDSNGLRSLKMMETCEKVKPISEDVCVVHAHSGSDQCDQCVVKTSSPPAEHAGQENISYSSIDNNGLKSRKMTETCEKVKPISEDVSAVHAHSGSDQCDQCVIKTSSPPAEQAGQENISYEVFVKEFPNFKEYERWMSEAPTVRQTSDAQQWTDDVIPVETTTPTAPNPTPPSYQDRETASSNVEHDISCIKNFDPSNCPKCLEQMSSSSSILERLKQSLDMDEPPSGKAERTSPPPPPPLPPPVKPAFFERAKSEPRANPGGTSGATFLPPQWSTTTEEPVSPEDTLNRPPEWPTVVKRGNRTRRWLERPKLICQSSDERDDDGSSPVRHPRRLQLLTRSDSQSEGDSDHTSIGTPQGTASPLRTASPIELSDSEGHVPRRYSKRPLRGPYGQMLEAEMKKPDANRKLQFTDDLKFLNEYTESTKHRKNKGSSQSLIVTGEPHLSTELSRSASTGESAKVPVGLSRCRVTNSHSVDDSPLRRTASVSTGTRADLPKNVVLTGPPVCHQRTTSSPSQLEGIALKAEQQLSKVDAFRRATVKSPPPRGIRTSPQDRIKTLSSDRIGDILTGPEVKDTRTHVVVELYETERSYVESLRTLVTKYLQPLKSPENAGLVDACIVDEIFYQVPEILDHHEAFLEKLQKRLEHWDIRQKIGDVFVNAFTDAPVIDMYTAFIDNWKTAKEAIKTTCQAKPAFARFLEAMAREHKGKLALDSLLIMPVQRVPRYELLIQTLLKHTEPPHPDHGLLLTAQKAVHDLAVKINCTEREGIEQEQQLQALRDLEALIEGCDLVDSEGERGRVLLRHDLVTLASGTGSSGSGGPGVASGKERVIFLFSNLLVIARIKRRTSTIRKPPGVNSASGGTAPLEAHKYRASISVPLDDVQLVKCKDESIRRVLGEMERLSEDVATLTQITEMASGLHTPHQPLDDLVQDMLAVATRQLADRQTSDQQLACLELSLNTSTGVKNISVIFTKPDNRTSWEESFNEAKQRLAMSPDRRPAPSLLTSVPIRKTRAGLQFTCAAPTIGPPISSNSGSREVGTRDVWVCNSDGYVGQVCVLSLVPEPNVTSCNGVCNARILCIAAIPASSAGSNSRDVSNDETADDCQGITNTANISISIEDTDRTPGNMLLDSSSSDSEDEAEDGGVLPDPEMRPAEADSNQTGVGVPCSGAVENEQISERESGSGATSTGISGAVGGAPVPIGLGGAGGAAEEGISQPTMWLGTEDGYIHVYSCCDNIRIKRNKTKIQHGAAVHCIIYLENRVFVALANGELAVYTREQGGSWSTANPVIVTVGTVAAPITKMVPVINRLWCTCQHTVKILNISTLQVEHTLTASTDSSRAVTCIVTAGLSVWLAVQNSAVLKLFHANSFEHLGDVNVAPAVSKMLANCDEIIRQHKSACLRVTSLLACKDLVWVGTSAGVLLTMPLPHIIATTTRLSTTPIVTGVPHGHTGHVRFLTVVEAATPQADSRPSSRPFSQRGPSQRSLSQRVKPEMANNPASSSSSTSTRLLVISGGDGYEDFRSSTGSDVAGKEDSTNHLLLWQV